MTNYYRISHSQGLCSQTRRRVEQRLTERTWRNTAFKAVGLREDKLVPGERLTITGNILTIMVAEVWVFEERVPPYILQWMVQPPPTKLYDFTHINRTLFRPQRSGGQGEGRGT